MTTNPRKESPQAERPKLLLPRERAPRFSGLSSARFGHWPISGVSECNYTGYPLFGNDMASFALLAFAEVGQVRDAGIVRPLAGRARLNAPSCLGHTELIKIFAHHGILL